MITDESIIEACNMNNTMSKACASLNMNHKTFAKRAKLLGVYKTNQGGKGEPGEPSPNKLNLNEILEGKHPQYQSNKLRKRLLDDKIKLHQCESCGITEWNGQPVPLELNHIDGNCHNHKLENLEIICPNCHAQTTTYRGKNIKQKY